MPNFRMDTTNSEAFMMVSSKARPGRELSPSTEHYLRAILELREERGYARVVDIATAWGHQGVGVARTHSARASRFDPLRPGALPQLSPVGRRIAADLRGRYTIVQIVPAGGKMRLPAERASAEACRWEHVISHEVADRLLDLLRFAGDQPRGRAKPRQVQDLPSPLRDRSGLQRVRHARSESRSYCACASRFRLAGRRAAGAQEDE